MNDISDTNNKLADSSTSDSEKSKYCETKPSSNMLGNEAEICDDRFKSKCVSTHVTYLSKWNITDKESLEWFIFIPTSNKLDVARLKLESERFGRMLHFKWNFKNDKGDYPINPKKTKSTSNPRNKNAAIEIYLSTLKEKLWIIEFLTNISKRITKGVGNFL